MAMMKSDQNWFLYTAWGACKISLLVPSSFEQELHKETASLTPSGDRDLDFSPFPLPPTPSKKEKNTFSSLAPYINTELFIPLTLASFSASAHFHQLFRV